MAGSLHEQARQDSCTGVSTAFTIVSVVIVSLRVYTRTKIVGKFGKDDLAMISALFFTLAYLAAIYVLRENGMGFSGVGLSLNQMHNLIKATLAIQCLYYVLVFSIKMSILYCYLRIAAQKSFERWVKATMYLLTIFVIICIICCLVQCIPLHKMWDLTGAVAGRCINTTAFFYFTSAFNIITDIWIIALPVRTLLSIQRPNREKLALVVIFGLGTFSCIASIVRLHAIRIYTESKDPFYDSAPINLWSMIEVNIGIWCASIPALKALVSSSQRERSRSTGYRYHSRDKSGTGRSESGTSATKRSREGTFFTEASPTGLHAHDAYDLSPVDNKELRFPMPAAGGLRKSSNAESDSSENIFFPGAYKKV